jgi:hypothetical protein
LCALGCWLGTVNTTPERVWGGGGGNPPPIIWRVMGPSHYLPGQRATYGLDGWWHVTKPPAALFFFSLLSIVILQWTWTVVTGCALYNTYPCPFLSVCVYSIGWKTIIKTLTLRKKQVAFFFFWARLYAPVIIIISS